jgi:hypothetical protein
MKCEIINPSDEVFIEHDNKKAISLAIVLLGEGWYGAKEVDGDFEVPLFAGNDFFKNHFGMLAQQAYDTMDISKLIEAFRSVHMDHERTSVNDIVKSAHSIADQLEQKMNDAKNESGGKK